MLLDFPDFPEPSILDDAISEFTRSFFGAFVSPLIHRQISQFSKDCDLLGLTPPITADAVRARVRELALVHHPDRGGDGTRMAEINAAADRLLGALKEEAP